MWEELKKPGEKRNAFTNQDFSPIKLKFSSWRKMEDRVQAHWKSLSFALPRSPAIAERRQKNKRIQVRPRLLHITEIRATTVSTLFGHIPLFCNRHVPATCFPSTQPGNMILCLANPSTAAAQTCTELNC